MPDAPTKPSDELVLHHRGHIRHIRVSDEAQAKQLLEMFEWDRAVFYRAQDIEPLWVEVDP